MASNPQSFDQMGFIQKLTSRSGLLVLGSSLLLIASIGLIFLFARMGVPDSALLFVGFLLVSMGGLALMAAVYRGLGHDTVAGDAFGLPSGSIRALLAISIMVLFVIFGLPFIRLDSAPSRLSDEAFETVVVPCAAVGNEVRRYGSGGMVAIPNYQGCGVPPDVATLKLYRQTREYSENQLELGKQILTAVITLLTTIIGFYFGSQSAIAAAAAANQSETRGRNGRGGDDGGGGGADDNAGGGAGDNQAEGSDTRPAMPAATEVSNTHPPTPAAASAASNAAEATRQWVLVEDGSEPAVPTQGHAAPPSASKPLRTRAAGEAAEI